MIYASRSTIRKSRKRNLIKWIYRYTVRVKATLLEMTLAFTRLGRHSLLVRVIKSEIRSLFIAMAMNANPCQSTGCKNQARKGQKMCGIHAEKSKPLAQMQPTALQPAVQLSVEDQATLHLLIQNHAVLLRLQDENKQLLAENTRMAQIEADRLRFEKESRDAWSEIDRLKKVNDELREDNERLRNHLAEMEGKMKTLEGHVASLNAEVSELKRDPVLIEVAQVFHDLEREVVKTISDDEDAIYLSLSHIDLRKDAHEVKQWEQHFGFKRKDLLALRTIITAIRTPRNRVEHPKADFSNVEQWRTALKDYIPDKVTDQSIENLLQTAVKLLS